MLTLSEQSNFLQYASADMLIMRMISCHAFRLFFQLFAIDEDDITVDEFIRLKLHSELDERCFGEGSHMRIHPETINGAVRRRLAFLQRQTFQSGPLSTLQVRLIYISLS